MSEFTININDDEIAAIVEKLIADSMVSKYKEEYRDTKYGIRKGMEKAVQNYIYSKKDEIIERCIERASAELVRKGLPKLIERMGAE